MGVETWFYMFKVFAGRPRLFLCRGTPRLAYLVTIITITITITITIITNYLFAGAPPASPITGRLGAQPLRPLLGCPPQAARLGDMYVCIIYIYIYI